MPSPFVANQYGLWCPNCQERIDELWPEACDHCGWPSPDYERFDDLDLPFDYPERDDV